ncbi:transposase [Porticoccaceae bacterium]|nr:transposase [Porticoccaceae bacterium]
MLEHRAQQAGHPVSANTRPPIASVAGATPQVYQSRRPERTVPYQLIQQHAKGWLAQAQAKGDSIPWYIEKGFSRFMDCGILAKGFARVRCDDCGDDFLVAFSCKVRGICPSCNTRRMVFIAAHLVEHVYPIAPVRQWVLSVPKRLRYFLHRDHDLERRVLQVFLRVIERVLRQHSLGAPTDTRFGGVSFVHRFGSALNAHTHYHCCFLDGVVGRGGEFCKDDTSSRDPIRWFEAIALTPAAITAAQKQIQHRVLRLFIKQGLLDSLDAAEMEQWEHGGGFSLNAEVRIEAQDRSDLERLFRYCERPIYAAERLSWQDEGSSLCYQLPKPLPNGQTQLRLRPEEFLDRLSMLLPRPREHRHSYHGVLAANARLRKDVVARAGLPIDEPPKVNSETDPQRVGQGEDKKEPRGMDGQKGIGGFKGVVSCWAMLLARIYDVFPLVCPQCGGSMRVLSFVIEAQSVEKILTHINAPIDAPSMAPARGPPQAGFDFDQRVDDDWAIDQTLM